MIYQHPLAYLLGLEGVALLHAFAGDYDREFTQAGMAGDLESPGLVVSKPTDVLSARGLTAASRSGQAGTGNPISREVTNGYACCNHEGRPWVVPGPR